MLTNDIQASKRNPEMLKKRWTWLYVQLQYWIAATELSWGFIPRGVAMTSQRLASRTRRDRRAGRTKPRPVAHAYGVPVPEGLHDAIETERGNLSKAESVLGCLVISMEYES